MIDTCIETVVAYARQQALLPPPIPTAGREWESAWSQARLAAARVWLQLPLLWQVRLGEAGSEWRRGLTHRAQSAAPGAVEVAIAALELAEMGSQPWEPAARHWPHTTAQTSLDAWYQAASILMFDVVFLSAAEHSRISPSNEWSAVAVPAACHRAVAVLIASHQAAIAQLHGNPDAAAAAAFGFTPAEQALISPPAPWYWEYIPPKRSVAELAELAALREQFFTTADQTVPAGLDARIAESLAEQQAKSAAQLAESEALLAEHRPAHDTMD